MAAHLHPGAPLIAKQGEIKAMIVDSTALPEQAFASIIESAFQSASQRCSALRCVYVQEDIATFASADIDNVIKAINAAGYDLTFGSQSRISNRVADISKRISANNIYDNRNQIGAVVGSQPFGVHGLSGTGPKAGGPLYMNRFLTASERTTKEVWPHPMPRDLLQAEGLLQAAGE